ncbi:HEL139Wp [Eremothecium sinecaudum]|uniref:HEL139Wp n=1 Tax=Eremothecium sinecaudum TaxID=45286 RepID=A0A0X8HTC1_9SACH|nr:HEL139Wp [Eremothecium sinecaudum]AMD21142.1 HEL139Wp [Eremothecium sinecaudum]
MEYEKLLFELQPIIEANTVAEVPLEEAYVERYIKVLDELAVHLRSESNRRLILETGFLKELFKKTAMVLDEALKGQDSLFLRMSSEMIRCIANSFVDNDENRNAFISGDISKPNAILDENVRKILELDIHETFVTELQLRTVALVRNFCLGNEEYVKRCSLNVTGPLLRLLEKESYDIFGEESTLLQLVLALLSDLVEFYAEHINISNVEQLAKLLVRFADAVESVSEEFPYEKEEEEEEEEEEEDDDDDEEEEDKENVEQEEADEDEEVADDPITEELFNLTRVLEDSLDRNDSLDFSDPIRCGALQRKFLEALDILYNKAFSNKLIIMRRITSFVGYVSANKTNTNIEDREMCYAVAKNSENEYAISAALFVLSNSISGRKDVDELLSHISLRDLIKCTSTLRDPFVYQSFLDIFKKCLNLVSIVDLKDDDYSQLFKVLKSVNEQCKYYTNLSPLLEATLKKILATFSSQALMSQPDLFEVVLNSGGVPVCLLLDKLSKKRETVPKEQLEQLIDALLQFNDPSSENQGVSIQYLFHVTKSLGIYVHGSQPQEIDELLGRYADKLKILLDSVQQLRDNDDSGSKSVLNNARFTCGLLIEHAKTPTALNNEPSYQALISLCKNML